MRFQPPPEGGTDLALPEGQTEARQRSPEGSDEHCGADREQLIPSHEFTSREDGPLGTEHLSARSVRAMLSLPS